MLKRFRDISLKYKIIGIIMLTSVILLLLASTAFFANDLITLRRVLVDNLSTTAGLIGSNSRAALTFNDNKAAEETLAALSTEPSIVSAGIYTLDGKNFAGYTRAESNEVISCGVCHQPKNLPELKSGRPVEGKPLSPVHLIESHFFGKKYLVFLRPIFLEEEMLGLVYIQSDLQELRFRLKRYVSICAIILTLSIFASYLLSSRFQRVISEPILNLSKTMKAVTENNNYSIQAEKHGDDEIGLLISSFNEMSRNLKKSIDELEDSEKKYHDLIEYANVGIVVSMDNKVTQINIRAEEIYGYTKKELIGQPPGILSPENCRKIHSDLISGFSEAKETKPMLLEEEGLKKDGTLFPIEISFAIPQENITIAVIRDITGRKQAENMIRKHRDDLDATNKKLAEEIDERIQTVEQLRATKDQIENLVETSIDPIIIADSKGSILNPNPAFIKMLEYSKDEVVGKKVYDFFATKEGTYESTVEKSVNIGEDFLKNQSEMISKLMEDGKISNWKTYYVHKNNKIIPIIQNIVILKNDAGERIGSYCIIRDITRQKRSEKQLDQYHNDLEKMIEERTGELAKANEHLQKNLITIKMTEGKLKKAKEVAESANEAKSQFLATMSHEIRTPLNGIIGMAELAMDTDLDDDQLEIFNTINEESNSLLSVINDVLDFSKIEAAKIDLEEIPFDLRVLMEDMINSLFQRVQQRGLELLLFLPPDLPTKMIGDPGKLRQILINLVGNAMKFTHKGEIYVKAETLEDLGERIKIHFSVKDTGIGISKDKLATIFDSFTQADGSTSRKYGGTGLGTTISKQFVKMMGGQIGVESNEGEGSTFWFTVNFVKQPERQGIQVKKDIDIHGLQVLVVDDNRTNRYILMEYLRSWDCRPVEVAGGEEALSLLRGFASSKEPFDLVLTDLMMPEMDGFEFAGKIRSKKDIKELPIIVLTSAGMLGDGNRCKALEINGYLTKPIRRDNLYRTIKSVMGISTEPEEHLAQELVTNHTIAEEHRKNVCILLAEDYPTNQQVALRHLHSAGYQVELAENGRQAVEAFKQKEYDLILMDIQMPEMDGYEATKQIRNLEKEKQLRVASCELQVTDKTEEMEQTVTRNPQPITEIQELNKFKISQVPIIAMTAHAVKEYKDRCIEVGMDDYISKPLRRKSLLETVEKWAGGIDDYRLKFDYLNSGNDNADKLKTANHQSSTINNDAAPMDFELALKEFEGQREILTEVIKGFLENVGAQIETICRAMSDGNAGTVADEAHSIKGGAANLCAYKLSGIAFELEKIGKSGNLESAAAAHDKLKNEFFRLETYFKNR